MSQLPTIPLTLADLRAAMQQPLPGQAAQQQMAPQPLDGQPSRWKTPDDCRCAGVLILLYPHSTPNFPNQWHLVFIERPTYPGVHSGQIALPGGRQELDEDLVTTALRETHEEVGVGPEIVTVLGQLTPFYIPPSNYCVYPTVGYVTQRPDFIPSENEVAAIIETPLTHLLDQNTRQTEIWELANYGPRQIPYFAVAGHKIWGATAVVLSEFLAVIEG